jgi:hypothetical protein
MLYSFVLSIVQSALITLFTVIGELLSFALLGSELDSRIVSISYLQSIFSYFIFSLMPYLFIFYIYALWLSEFRKEVNFKMVALLNLISINSIFLGPGAFFGFPNADPFNNPVYPYLITASLFLSAIIFKYEPFEKQVNTVKKQTELFEN